MLKILPWPILSTAEKLPCQNHREERVRKTESVISVLKVTNRFRFYITDMDRLFESVLAVAHVALGTFLSFDRLAV